MADDHDQVAAPSAVMLRPRRSLLRDQAYQTLRELILSEALEPGTLISERQLVKALGGMSKTPIRVALERLQADGLISVSPQQGILVREISVQEIAEVFDVRMLLEPFVVEQLAGHVTDGQRAAIEGLLAEHEQATAAGDTVRQAQLDTDFHVLLCKLLGNREIVHVVQRNHDKLARLILRTLRRVRGRPQSSLAEHRAIAEALFAGDGPLAVQRVREHLVYGKNALVS